jgi:murein DD-endopeptidase
MRPQDLVGTPYVDKGSSLEGVDCWGLIWLGLELCFSRSVPRYDQYESAKSATARRLIQAGWADWEKIELGNELPGDVLAFRGERKEPTHCGLVIGDGRFLHCMAGRNACIERYDRGVWKALLVRIGRWNS